MAITVKHGTSAGAVASAALAGGLLRGRRGGRGGPPVGGGSLSPKDKLAEAEREREFRAEQGSLEQERALERARLGYEHQSAEAKLQRDFQAGQSQLGFDRSQQAADAAQARERSDLEFSLTTKQKAELEQIANAEAAALASPDFTADEKKELQYRFAQRRAGIQPVARPKAPTAAEKFKASTFTDAKTGRVYALDAQGIPGRAIYEPPEKLPSMQDRIKAYDAAAKLLATEDGSPPDRDKVREVAEEILGMGGEDLPEPISLGGGAAWGGNGSSPAEMAAQRAQGEVAAAVAKGEQALESELSNVTSGQTEKALLDPAAVQNLPTVDYQLEQARLAVTELENAKPYKLQPFLKLGPSRREGEIAAAKQRVTALEARRRSLQNKADMLEAKAVIRRAIRGEE